MPVSIEVTTSKVLEMFTKLGFSSADVDWVASHIKSISYVSQGLHFDFGKYGKYKIPVKIGVIDLVITGNIDTLSKDVVKSEFNKLFTAIEKAKPAADAEAEADGPVSVKTPWSGVDLAADPSQDAPGGAHMQLKPGEKATIKFLSPDKMLGVGDPNPKASQKCKLAEAEILLQPVYGTDVGSTYYLIAKFKGMKIAARVQGESLSIRAEGDLLPYKAALTALGMSKSAKGHYSMHFGIGDASLFQRTLGSVLFGVGVEWEAVLFDAKKLKAACGVAA